MTDWLWNMARKTTADNRYIIPWPPIVWTAPVSGKTYAGSGGVQLEVSEETTITEIENLFCWGNEARKYWDSNYSDEPQKIIEVKGSKGRTYKVTKKGNSWKCECSGFRFRQKCKHITNLKSLIDA